MPRAHFVSIDTEGYDPLVMYGMERALTEKRIDVLEFEFNRKWKAVLQSARPMRPVVDWLHARGYVCFWQGNRGQLAQANGGCWKDEYHERISHRWSNLVCTARADLIEVFRSVV